MRDRMEMGAGRPRNLQKPFDPERLDPLSRRLYELLRELYNGRVASDMDRDDRRSRMGAIRAEADARFKEWKMREILSSRPKKP